MNHSQSDTPNAFKGLVAGAVAGLTATWVMTQVQTALSKMAPKNEGGGGESATVQAAEALSRSALDQPLPDSQKTKASNVVHYGFGTVMGIVYGLAAEYAPVASVGGGIPFGTALFVGADEIAVPALQFSPPPTETPASKHLTGLLAHLVYGISAEGVRRTFRSVL